MGKNEAVSRPESTGEPSAGPVVVTTALPATLVSLPPARFDCVAVVELKAGLIQPLSFKNASEKAVFNMFSSVRIRRIRAEVRHTTNMDGFSAICVAASSPETVLAIVAAPVVSYAFCCAGSPAILQIDSELAGFGSEVKLVNTEAPLPVLTFFNSDSSLASKTPCGFARIILTFECSGAVPSLAY